MSNLTLHIGMGKCGSSAIQALFRLNRETLTHLGVIALGPDIPTIGFDQGQVGNPVKLQELIGFLSAEARAIGANHVLFSAEALSNILDPGKISRFAEMIRDRFAETRVIVYLRRQDLWIQSAYHQWGIVHKTYPGKVKTLPEFLELRKRQLDYLSMLQRWSAAFGDASIVVQPFERQQLTPDLLRQFIRLARLPTDVKYRFPSGNTNPSFGPELLELMRLYNNRFESPCVHPRIYTFFRENLDHRFFCKGGESFNLMEPKLRYQVFCQYLNMNNEIARRFLNRPNGPLFYDPAPPSDDPTWAPPGAGSLEELVPILLDLLVDLDQKCRTRQQ